MLAMKVDTINTSSEKNQKDHAHEREIFGGS
jgi:hypothetical protein